MKFEYIKKVEGEVNGFQGKKVKTGDIVEYEGFFAEKAMKEPDYRKVEGEQSVNEPVKKRRRKKIEN